jgi:REP element-mobilizing transposase RayT
MFWREHYLAFHWRMPRKPTIFTSEYPYHIRARSNNREHFYLPVDECWSICSELLQEANIKFGFQVHAFLIMNNHYHLIATATNEYPLYKVMEWFQRSVTRRINDRAARINHVFGGPYKATIILSEDYYRYAIKYLYRNPVEALMVKNVEHYPYSTLHPSAIPLSSPTSGIASQIIGSDEELLRYYNREFPKKLKDQISISLNKRIFKFANSFAKKKYYRD